MRTIELARRLAQLGETKDALRAYALVLNEDAAPEELLEAAAYTLDNGGDYKIAYTTFVGLYGAGCFRERILPLMRKVFYEPNIKLLKNRYERNCKLLAKYPYLFRKDFLPFEELPLVFFPYDDHNGYVPFAVSEGEFLGFVKVKDTVVSRNFFRDLDKPVLADDVFSQYELEYLVDNVRPSEWVGRENHVYLHYADWAEFCAWLQVLTMRPLLEDKKLVFLIGDEIAQYPIDFKARFGVDYSRYPVRPVGIREVNKLIWHTQLSSHNGGDFFNEIFDAHPNLLSGESFIFSSFSTVFGEIREKLKEARNLLEMQAFCSTWGNPHLVEDLYRLKNLTDKDLLVTLYLRDNTKNKALDPAGRIVPAIFFQPHFHNIFYDIGVDDKGRAVLDSAQAEELHESEIVRGFKYIKTFTPLRRPTTSHAATVRFSWAWHTQNAESGETTVMPDFMVGRLTNRSFMRDPEDRLYHDSVLVRFEDGKLNPKATFTALAAFLDVPYTESMTRCSMNGEYEEWRLGFNTSTVDAVYPEYANDTERYFIEYFLRDVYEFYGYDFQWYDGQSVDEARVRELIDGFTTIDGYIRKSWKEAYESSVPSILSAPEAKEAFLEQAADDRMLNIRERRLRTAQILLGAPYFVNRRGQPLEMMPLLPLDPALMEQERYR